MTFETEAVWARSELWAALAGVWFGIAIAGAFSRRLTKRGVWNRFRGWMPIAVNVGALALVAAVLFSGSEPGGLGERWRAWPIPFGAALVLFAVGFRFPRAAGIPILLLLVTVGWLVTDALRGFSMLETGKPDLTVQPLTAQETVTVFNVRVDLIHAGVGPTLYRVRKGMEDPAEWWWPWAVSRGWAESSGPRVPLEPLKFGVYRLVIDGKPRWELSRPTLLP
jgi:hypothetical protein